MSFPNARIVAVICHLALAVLGTPGSAAAEFENGLVPLEVVTDVLGDNISGSLPADFPLPGKALPSGMSLRLVASRDATAIKEIYLRTRAPVMEFRTALADAYVAAGWTDVSYSPVRRDSLGIRTLYVSLCHDELGSLTINENGTLNGENRVVVRYQPGAFISPGVSGSTCAETKVLNEIGYSGGVFAFFLEQVPELYGPEDTVQTPDILGRSPFFVGALSSGSSTQGFRSNLRGSLELPDYLLVQVYVHMVEQLEEQGWSLENHVNSGSVSSSIWSKSVAGPDVPILEQSWDMDLTGILTLIDQGENTWLVQFEVWSE